MGTYYEESIIDSKLIKKHKLNNFDNKKLHNFIKISFKNLPAYNKAKKIFYQDITIGNYFERKLIKEGYIYENDDSKTNCYLYEGDIPPLLKLFHIKEISPSGVDLFKKIKKSKLPTHCRYNYIVDYNNIIPMKNMESIVNYNIKCSFDIEASSSHGDFPFLLNHIKN